MKTSFALLEAFAMLLIVAWLAVAASAAFPYLAAFFWLAVVLIVLTTIPPIVRRGFENNPRHHQPQH